MKEVSRLKTLLLAHQELTNQENIKSCPTTVSHDYNKVFLTRLANILVNSLGLEEVTGVVNMYLLSVSCWKYARIQIVDNKVSFDGPRFFIKDKVTVYL